jgi:hypothetical protein
VQVQRLLEKEAAAKAAATEPDQPAEIEEAGRLKEQQEAPRADTSAADNALLLEIDRLALRNRMLVTSAVWSAF